MSTVPPMQDGCPWSELSHFAPPNVKWCEAQVCGWIVEPANTWSNLAYILLGALLLWRAAGSTNVQDMWYVNEKIPTQIMAFPGSLSQDVAYDMTRRECRVRGLLSSQFDIAPF